MSTELSIVNPANFLALQPGSDVSEALTANLVEGESMMIGDLTVVKTPTSGSTKWTIEDVTGEVVTDAITGILVYYGPHGVLWPSNESVEGTKPLLVTHDLKIARKIGDDYGDLDEAAIEACRNDDGSYDWKALPYNQFGTGKNGIGKRCKEQRLMAILRESDAFPLLIRAQPGSLKSVTTFIKKLPCAHFRAIVELKLEKAQSKGGQAYAMIKPRLVAQLTKEQGEVVKTMYTENLGEAIRNAALQADFNSGQDDLE